MLQDYIKKFFLAYSKCLIQIIIVIKYTKQLNYSIIVGVLCKFQICLERDQVI